MSSSKPPQTNGCLIGCGSIVLLFILFAMFSSCSTMLQQPKTPEQKAAQETQKAAEEKEKLDKWYSDYSQYSCEDNVKEKLREPRSYEKSSNFITTDDTGLQKGIIWKFRATNGFGGYTVSTAICLVKKQDNGSVSTTIVGE